MDKPFQICKLWEQPSFLPVCAAWAYGQWGSQHTKGSLNRALSIFSESLQKDALPQTLIAHEVNKPLGMASLWRQDPPSRLDLTPWIASVYVHPFHRGKGIALALVTAVEDLAHDLGFKALYLVTEEARGLYLKAGWHDCEKMESVHGPCILMTKAI